jgi:hypothetical protein
MYGLHEVGVELQCVRKGLVVCNEVDRCEPLSPNCLHKTDFEAIVANVISITCVFSISLTAMSPARLTIPRGAVRMVRER